ncbi:MAG: ABC transporter ATP-binding protein [Micrococcales bacterium]|nr:ABC transporter ATP-binding protein [Micrococcales bacterium]
MIETRNLSKSYGPKRAVDDLTCTVLPGKVTGFLGPNGAGKSTTMRMIVGLDHPTSGTVIVNGRRYADHPAPLQEVGALLDAKAAHPGRSARTHLRIMAVTEGISTRRVDEVIELAGLESVADKRVGSFSLGMAQRLGIAAALLGDPATLILDEPVNGLDPEGVTWVRNLVKYLAGQGRTVFLSSHLMSEMSQTADHLIVLGQGKLIADSPIEDIIARASGVTTRVRSAQADAIVAHFAGPGIRATSNEPGLVTFDGISAEQIGDAAAAQGWVLHELTPVTSSLEQAYMELTEGTQEFSSGMFDVPAADRPMAYGASDPSAVSPAAPVDISGGAR